MTILLDSGLMVNVPWKRNIYESLQEVLYFCLKGGQGRIPLKSYLCSNSTFFASARCLL